MMLRGFGDATGTLLPVESPPGPAASGASCVTSDPGFTVGLQTWSDFTSWSGNLADITSIPTWICYPMMNLGIITAPVIAAVSLVFLLGRATKRGR